MERLLSEAQFYEFVELVYSAGCDPGNWQTFAAAVQAAVPGSAFHALIDIKNTQLAFQSATAGIGEDFIASYLASYASLNPFNAAFAKLPVGRTYSSRELGPAGWLDKDVFVNEWMLPAGDFTHGACIVVFRDADRQLRVTLDLPTQLAHLEPLVQSFLEDLKPHLQRAFRVNERLSAAVATANALDVMIARIDGAAYVLDAQARVLVQNNMADTLCRRGDVLRVDRTGKISFRMSSAQTAYAAASASAILPSLVVHPHAFRVEGGDFEGVAVVLPLRVEATDLATAFGPQPKALVVIRNLAERTVVPKQLCQQAFGLTNAEAELAMRLVRGLTVQEAAAALGISSTTARNQLAAVMRKAGVSRQADLVATLLALAPTLKVTA